MRETIQHKVTPAHIEDLRKWVEDLETTDAPQITGKLSGPSSTGDVGFCCLGRLCVALGVKFDPHGPYPPELVAGLDELDYGRYSSLNDEDLFSFKKIAKVVREDFDLGESPTAEVVEASS